MDFSQYQELAMRTAPAQASVTAVDQLVAVAGLTGEAGEVAELFKKKYGHNKTFDSKDLSKELGDVLWYLTRICQLNGLDLGQVAQGNIEKLKARYPEGFVQGGGNR